MKNDNKAKTIVTGVTCPRCGKNRAEQVRDEVNRPAYRCTCCNHVWSRNH